MNWSLSTLQSRVKAIAKLDALNLNSEEEGINSTLTTVRTLSGSGTPRELPLVFLFGLPVVIISEVCDDVEVS